MNSKRYLDEILKYSKEDCENALKLRKRGNEGYGVLENVQVGQVFSSLDELRNSGVHPDDKSRVSTLNGDHDAASSVIVVRAECEDEGFVVFFNGGIEESSQLISNPKNLSLILNEKSKIPVRVARTRQMDSQKFPALNNPISVSIKSCGFFNKGSFDLNSLPLNCFQYDGCFFVESHSLCAIQNTAYFLMIFKLIRGSFYFFSRLLFVILNNSVSVYGQQEKISPQSDYNVRFEKSIVEPKILEQKRMFPNHTNQNFYSPNIIEPQDHIQHFASYSVPSPSIFPNAPEPLQQTYSNDINNFPSFPFDTLFDNAHRPSQLALPHDSESTRSRLFEEFSDDIKDYKSYPIKPQSNETFPTSFEISEPTQPNIFDENEIVIQFNNQNPSSMLNNSHLNQHSNFNNNNMSLNNDSFSFHQGPSSNPMNFVSSSLKILQPQPQPMVGDYLEEQKKRFSVVENNIQDPQQRDSNGYAFPPVSKKTRLKHPKVLEMIQDLRRKNSQHESLMNYFNHRMTQLQKIRIEVYRALTSLKTTRSKNFSWGIHIPQLPQQNDSATPNSPQQQQQQFSDEQDYDFDSQQQQNQFQQQDQNQNPQNRTPTSN